MTGTYYAAVPPDSAPLILEDPRGRSPFDVIVGVEATLQQQLHNHIESYDDGCNHDYLYQARLRYGAASGMAETCTPPFDRPLHLAPKEGELTIFPPWLVHSVPASTPDGQVRVSFSFNLLGGWDRTARVEDWP